MAQVIINKKVEFAYVSNDLLTELAKELESRYLYQKILIVDNKYDLSQEINALIKKVKCDFLVVKNIDECKDMQCFACIIVVNCHDLNNIKNFCTTYNKPYILALTKIFDTTILNSQIIDCNKQIINCNYPLGVVLVKSRVLKKQDFICKFLLLFASSMFDNEQLQIDNLFFYNSKNNYFDTQNNIGNSLKNIIWQTNEEEIFNKIAKLYLFLCIQKSTKQLTLLDRVTELGCDFAFDNQHKIEAKFLLQYSLSLLIKSFFESWTKKLKSTINLKKHKMYLEKYNLNCDFKLLELQEQKIEFLLTQFRQKLVGYSNDQIILNDKIKSLIADINVDFLYSVFNFKFKNSVTDFICLEPIVYNKDSILKIFSANGLLNFDF